MATVVTWHCRNQAAMACRSAVKAPNRRTLRGKGAGAPVGEGGGDAMGSGGTQTHNSVAPISMPAACGLRVCSNAAIAGSGCDDADLRRGMVSSTTKPGSPVAAARTTAAAHREGSRGLQATGAAGGGVAGGGGLSHRGWTPPAHKVVMVTQI